MALVFVVAVLFVMFDFYRNDDDVFIKIAIWRYQFEGGAHAYYFVIENDGTFTSYYGIVRNPRNHRGETRIQRHDFLSSVEEREVVLLSEQEFQDIAELVRIVTAIENGSSTSWGTLFRTDFVYTALYHNRKHYGGISARSGYFQELISDLVYLSPLEVCWHHWQGSWRYEYEW